MPNLPEHPDLDQLRRQARELLRAATSGEPRALDRLHAVSTQLTLSAAQLALARGYGLASWPALRTEAERRRRLSESAAQPLELADNRRSFGGATAIETEAGLLSLGTLFVGPDRAVFDDARLVPSENARGWLEQGLEAALAVVGNQDRAPKFGDVMVTDDQNTRYTLRIAGMGFAGPGSEAPRRPVQMSLRIDPVPARECGWFELRNQDGATIRLLPATHPVVRVGRLVPASGSPVERKLSEQALFLIGHRLLGGADDDMLPGYCSNALASAAELQQSDTTSELPNQVARLCATLTGQHATGGLRPDWSGMLDAAQRIDGARRPLDVGAVLPPIDETEVRLDSLSFAPESWGIHFRSRPGWWRYSEDRHRKWAALAVAAEDDLGGRYMSMGGGDNEIALQCLPRLDPLARAVTLTFRGQHDQVVVDVSLLRSPT